MKKIACGAGLAAWMVMMWLPLVPWTPYLWEIGRGLAKRYIEAP